MTFAKDLSPRDRIALALTLPALAAGLWTLWEAYLGDTTGPRSLVAYLACSLAAAIAGVTAQLSGPEARLRDTLPGLVKWGWVAVSVLMIVALIRGTAAAL
ncbi:MAG: hypothetical protein HLUCCA08_06990 [Rhodobacteraceae bacterium HLUCCA08]|nr:MAG: hypothetical protein HLUCCA08_06990 [Rhodobacteraceae bacterium HLUCCA08]